MEKGRVCVTGGTGFLGSSLIKFLLQHGYSVNTTIRNSSNPERKNNNISYLADLAAGKPERLKIFRVGLDEPESFAPTIQGCIGVFHVAHQIDFESEETEEDQIKRLVNVVLGILQACLDSKTVKRVVYTSSASTVFFNESRLDRMDEDLCSDVDYIRRDLRDQIFSSYAITKVFAEKAALEFADKNGLDVVCKNLLRTCFVHIEDVVRAHVFLFENLNAKGRYICSALELTIEQLSECLSAKYPNHQYPIPCSESLKGIEGFATAGVSSKKLLDMGFKYRYGIEEIFDGAIESCKLKGFL